MNLHQWNKWQGYPLRTFAVSALLACLVTLGCGSDSDDGEDLSQNRPPYVGLSHKTVVIKGDSIVFDAERSGDLDLDDFITEYQLLLGDGTPLIKSSSPLLYHTFEQAGTFAVRLTIFDPEGAKTALDSQITVIQSGVVACTQDEMCPFGACRDGFCATKRCSHDEACPFSGHCEEGECDE